MKIRITECNWYKDGGTVEYRDATDKRYFLDGRFKSKTVGELFDRYPDKPGAIMLNKSNYNMVDPLLERMKRML